MRTMKSRIFLSLLLLLVAFSVPAADAPPAAPESKVKKIGVEEFDKIAAKTNVVILDVRSPAEFEKGRIPKAINIDINSLAFADKVSALDTNKTYIVNCAVGMRSARACKKLETMGFKELFDFSPGFDGWKKAGRPIEK